MATMSPGDLIREIRIFREVAVTIIYFPYEKDCTSFPVGPTEELRRVEQNALFTGFFHVNR